MAGNTQIDPNTEGGLFRFLHGLKGVFWDFRQNLGNRI